MKKIYYDNYADFVDSIMELENDDINRVGFVADYNLIRDIASYLISEYEYDLFSVSDFHMPEFATDYKDAYLLQISEDGLYIQPAKYGENQYVMMSDEDIVFVHSDVNSKFAVQNKNATLIEFTFDIEEDEEELEKSAPSEVHTEWSKDSNGGVRGFTQSGRDKNTYWSRSYYSTNPDDVRKEYSRLSDGTQEKKDDEEEFDVDDFFYGLRRMLTWL